VQFYLSLLDMELPYQRGDRGANPCSEYWLLQSRATQHRHDSNVPLQWWRLTMYWAILVWLGKALSYLLWLSPALVGLAAF